MIEWVVVYEDFTVFTNEMGDPWEAPRTKVQIVAEIDPEVQAVIRESPVGLWGHTKGRWWGYDHIFDWTDYLAECFDNPLAPLRGSEFKYRDDWLRAKKIALEVLNIEKRNRYPEERV